MNLCIILYEWMNISDDMDKAVLEGLVYTRYMLYFLAGIFLLFDSRIFPESRIFGIVLLAAGLVVSAFSYGAKRANYE